VAQPSGNQPHKVVFVGDCNVDIIMDGLEAEPEPDREVGCRSFELAMGATSCLTASAYARLGGEAWACSLRGEDSFGGFMDERLREEGVRTEYVRAAPGLATGVTVNLVRGAARYQVTHPGAMGAFSAADVPDAAFDGLRHLHVAGMYQLRALLPGVAALLSRARAAGASTSIDCQWDPAERWEGLREWLPLLDWLFVNGQEARSMTGAPDVEAALRGLGRLTRSPVVKAGAEGGLALDGGELLRAPSIPVAVVDTIGAGDNFDAGFLFASLELGLAPREALAFAAAAGSLSCTFRGGTGGRSSWRDVKRFMERRG
jgi:sugar/nucleoside kinase (ribokinase family)